MKYLLMLVVLLITGCENPMNQAKQDYVCRDKGGVYRHVPAAFKVTCNSGEMMDYLDVVLPPEYYPNVRKTSP